MMRENIFTIFMARMARVFFALFTFRPFIPPKKVLILHPCCLSQVMLATPLLAALHESYPNARFDWAVSDWAKPALLGNPRLTELISTGSGSLHELSRRERRLFIQKIREQQYDMCFIPSRSSLLSYIAWQAKIPQRIGINWQERGFAHTIGVSPPEDVTHAGTVYMALAEPAGVPEEIIAEASMEFYPPDWDRTVVTNRLVEEVDWLGDVPLVLIHPGGGSNPLQTNLDKKWPLERFVLLGNHLARKHKARVILVGGAEDRETAVTITGLMATDAVNFAGELSLGQLGALCEVADLYIGNDAGSTHVAAAVGCPILAIYGPSDPAITSPYRSGSPIELLWHEYHDYFSWEDGVSVSEATFAADALCKRKEV